jgi:RNA polymerase sigma-70 factor (ECF subfamily)
VSKTSDKNNSIPAPRLSPDELARLVVAAQDNKDIHFADLYKAAWPQVYYLAFGMLGTEIDASDVAQQAFINIFEHLDALKDPQAAAAWVNKTTLNAARNFLKNRKRHQSRTVSLDALTDTPDAHDQPAAPTQHTPHPQQPHAEFTPGHTLEQQERNALIFDLTQDLPDASREVIILHYQEEHSIAAIARILDLTENAVTLRLHRARKQLRAALEAFEASGSLSRFALATFGVGGALQAHAQTALIPAPSQAPWQALLEGIGGSASQPDTPRASRAKNAQLTRSYVTTPHVLMIAVAGVAAVAGITFALTHNTLLGGGGILQSVPRN